MKLSEDDIILMAYGNPNAIPISNGSNTFIFFDDFLGTDYNHTIWEGFGSPLPTVSDSWCTVPTGGSNNGLRINDTRGIESNRSEVRMKLKAYNAGGWVQGPDTCIWSTDPDPDSDRMQIYYREYPNDHHRTASILNGISGGGESDISSTNWVNDVVRFFIWRKDYTAPYVSMEILEADHTRLGNRVLRTDTFYDDYSPFGIQFYLPSSNCWMKVDWIFVREYHHNNEPSWTSCGSEQIKQQLKMAENNQWQWSNFTWDNYYPVGTSIGWRIYYNDTNGNINHTDMMNFVVTPDVTSPNISNITDYPDPQNMGGWVEISCEVVDNVLIENVFLNITYPDSSSQNFSIRQNKTGNIFYCNKSYNDLGIYTYQIWAIDPSNNTAISAVYNFTITGPDIWISPEEINSTIQHGDEKNSTLTIGNNGNGILEYNNFISSGITNNILYDDWSAENAWATYDAGNGWAVRFTPTSYPVKVTKARFFIWPDWPDTIHQDFRVLVLDDDGMGGSPGTIHADLTTTSNAFWVVVDLSQYNIVIESGDFYIANIQLTNYPNCEGQATDENSPWNARSWQLAYGTWSQLASSYGNMIIRAEIIESVTWLDASPKNGTIDPGNHSDISLFFNATNLNVGIYNAFNYIYSNDPDEDFLVVPVSLNVTPANHDLAIVEINVDEIQYHNSETTVYATIENKGLKNETNVIIQMFINGTIENETTINTLNSTDTITVILNWTPNLLGEFNITIYCIPVPGENITYNNIQNIQVLVIDGTPPEWRNQNQSTNEIIVGDSLSLSAQGKDNVALDWAVLATNETGEWQLFNWLDSEWKYRKKLWINHSKVTSKLENFPVLVSLIDPDLKNKAQSDGDDLVFTDYLGIKLNHEIEHYNSSTGELIAWVNINHINSERDTEFYMYYGNQNVGTQEKMEETWNSFYKGVYHLNEEGIENRNDSSGTYELQCQNYEGNETCLGIIGGADNLDGIDDFLQGFESTAYLNGVEGTYSAWIYVNNGSLGKKNMILTKQQYAWGGWNLQREQTNTLKQSYYVHPNWYELQSDVLEWNNNTWYYVVATRGPDGMRIYRNGVLVANNSITIPYIQYGSSSNYLNIGQMGSGSYGYDWTYDGKIDEVRVSVLQRNQSWILTEYNNQFQPESFIAVGEEKTFENTNFYESPLKMQEDNQWQWSNFTWQNLNISEEKKIGWRIYYLDTYQNTNSTDIMDFTILPDILPPIITNITANPPIQNTGEPVNISCTITDNGAIKEAKVNITGPPGFSPINNSLEQKINDSTYWYSSKYTIIGNYSYLIWAQDYGNNINMSSVYYFQIKNNPPIFNNPNPTNGSTGKPLSLTWSIQINDPEGDPFNWDIECSNGQSNGATGASNGTKSLSLSGLVYSTTYTVWVNATDLGGSGLYTREWYIFTTRANIPPSLGPPSPANGSTGQPLAFTWSIEIFEPDDLIDWSIECSNGQSNSGTNDPPGTKSLALSGLSYSTMYTVWVNVTDGYAWVREWFTFTTKPNSPPNTPSNPNPAHGATGVDIDADVSWVGGDPDPGDTVTYDVYFGTTSPPPKVASNQSATTYDPGIMDYNTQYYWMIVAWDNHGALVTGPIWEFTTEGEPEPDLDCDGTLSWTGVSPGSTVTGSFKVKNIGDTGSLLDWEIDEYPEWGYWAFDPDEGEDLTSGSSVTVQVTVIAPDEPNEEFTGTVKVVNKENASDYDTVMVTLVTPVSQPSQQSTSTLFIQFLQKLIQQFPILEQMLSLSPVFSSLLNLQ